MRRPKRRLGPLPPYGSSTTAPYQRPYPLRVTSLKPGPTSLVQPAPLTTDFVYFWGALQSAPIATWCVPLHRATSSRQARRNGSGAHWR